jgi:thiopeptide-type bacteriocin biosynthesis protein
LGARIKKFEKIMKNNVHWISLRLFHPEPHEGLLTDTIYPFLGENREAFSNTFFIRYSEGGPHLRLYLLPAEEDKRAELEQKAYHWFLEKLPENAVELFLRGEEVERFGGDVGMSISEEQFQFSSELVLALFAQNREQWNYDLALALSLQMQLTLALGFGLQNDELSSFFTTTADYWLPFAFPEEQRPLALNVFEKAYTSQKENFIELCADVRRTDSPWSAWQQGNALLSLKLKEAWEQDKLEVAGLSLLQKKEAPEWQDVRNALLNEYIHLHNNRLGVLNHDEPYLAYLLARSLG